MQLTHREGGRRRWSIGVIGDVGDVDVAATLSSKGINVDPHFASELQGYADRGAGLPQEVIDKALDAYKAAKDYAAKAEAVGEDASVGAAVGAMVPILGEIGVGEVIGAVVGAIYGVFDNFGGEIHDLFNPPDFSPDDYHAMQLAQLASGAIPVWGVPPDLYGACIYPDGALSGGSWPYPGTWNGEIRDQAAYDRAKLRDQAAAQGMCVGPLGTIVDCKRLVPLAIANRAHVLHVLKAVEHKDVTDKQQVIDLLKRQKQLASVRASGPFIKSPGQPSSLLRAFGITPTASSPATSVRAAPVRASTPTPPSNAGAAIAVGVGALAIAGSVTLAVRAYRRRRK